MTECPKGVLNAVVHSCLLSLDTLLILKKVGHLTA